MSDLIPIVVVLLEVAVQRLKFGSARDGHVERLCGDEGVNVEEVCVDEKET